MAFSGGTFSRLYDWTTDRDNGVKILASRMDQEFDGMATGLSTCILKDGTQTCTAAIPFAEGLTVPDNKTIILGTNSDITIQYDESTNDSLEIAANVEGAALGIVLKADQGDDNADQHKVGIADGGTLTMASKISGSFVSYLTHTPNSTVASSTTAVAGNLTVGGDLTLGSGAVISEAELETIDGITPGTAAASKAMVLDASLDISGGRNLTISGELDAATLDVSGDVDIDGTLETDALSIASTAVTATAAELNILDGVTATAAELNYSDTGAAVGTVVASKVVTADANKDVASFRNITLTGELDAGSLDVSGDADIDGTLEADAMTLNGTAITATATLDTGISNNNVPKFTSGVADDDFLRVAGTAIEGRSAAEVLSDIAAAPAAGSSNIVTTGALNSGSITSGFGAIDNGASAITTTGVITGGTLEATADTSAGDNAAIGYTAAEGLILTGQGSTSDITLKNDADATVFTVPTGTDDILFPDSAKILMGASSDLQIYHDGSSSRIVNATGNLKLQADIFEILNESGTENYMTAVSNGAVNLFHNNNGKLATTATGCTITGTVTADGLTVDTSTLHVDATNNSVGIGTTSPSSELHVKGSAYTPITIDGTSGGTIDFYRNGSRHAQIFTDNAGGDIIFRNNTTTERMRIDSSGNLLVGTTTNDIYDSSSEVGSQISDGYLAVARASTVAYFNRLSSDGDIVEFRKGGTTVGAIGTLTGRMYAGTGDVGLFFDSTNNMITPYSIDAGDTTNGVIDLGYSSRRFNKGYFNDSVRTRYFVGVDDSNTYIEMGGSDVMKFVTGGSERGRFSATGSLLVAQSASDTPGISNTTQGAAIGSTGRIHSSVNGAFSSFNRNSSDGGVIQFHREGNKVGEITVNSSSTAYSTSSDRRLKSNIQDAASASANIDAIQVRQFDWNADDSHQDYGLIAQELQPIEPMAVSGDENSDEMMSVDYSKLVPMLIKEIQELRGRVAALESN